MADLRPDPGTHSDDTPSEAGMPRWVKVFVLIGAALLVLLIATQFIGGGHGPRRHGGGGDETPVSTEDRGHTPPVDHGP